MANLLKALRDAIPQTPLLVGEVVAVVGVDLLRISMPGGGLATARGAASVGDHVFFRPGGAVEGEAPAGAYVDIEV